MSVKIHPSWASHLESEFDKSYFKELRSFVRGEYERTKVYPAPAAIFRAFDLCPFENVRVVILGQDPYHGPGQANGMCFAVNDGVPFPPSLKNIFKELQDDLGHEMPPIGHLESWAKQGVLLLNATLTVVARSAGSHQGKGWESFTDAVIQKLSDEKENLVFILWGRYAQDKGKVIDTQKHLVISSPHPSPFSAHSGFFGSKPFSKSNEYLKWNGLEAIDWSCTAEQG